MSRRITTAPAAPQPAPAPQPPGVAQQAAAPAPAAPTKEDYLGRLLKYIPAELVGLYLAARGVVPESTSDYDKTLWVVAALTWILVPIYMYVVTTRGGQHAWSGRSSWQPSLFRCGSLQPEVTLWSASLGMRSMSSSAHWCSCL